MLGLMPSQTTEGWGAIVVTEGWVQGNQIPHYLVFWQNQRSPEERFLEREWL